VTHDYLTVTFSRIKHFALTVTCYRELEGNTKGDRPGEYNSRQTQGASNAISFTSDFLHVLNKVSMTTVYRAFLIKVFN
jgi:hypothetical protein